MLKIYQLILSFLLLVSTANAQMVDSISIRGTAVNATCPYSDNGSVTGLQATGGTPPYEYSWSTTSNIDSLLPGTYTVTVTDSFGTTASQAFTIGSNGGNITPVFNLPGRSTIICQGDSIQINVTTGFAGYNWNNGDSTQTIYADAAGEYSVQVTDTFGCVTHSDTLHLTSDSVQHLTIDTLVSGASVNLKASLPYLESYSWNFGNGVVLTGTDSTLNYIYPDSGTYTIQLISQQYCGYDTTMTAVKISQQISGVLDISDENLKLTVYPNPFHDAAQLILTGKYAEEYSVKLYDVQGRLIRSLGQTTNGMLTIQRDGIPAGEYLLYISDNRVKAALKLVAQ